MSPACTRMGARVRERRAIGRAQPAAPPTALGVEVAVQMLTPSTELDRSLEIRLGLRSALCEPQQRNRTAPTKAPVPEQGLRLMAHAAKLGPLCGPFVTIQSSVKRREASARLSESIAVRIRCLRGEATMRVLLRLACRALPGAAAAGTPIRARPRRWCCAASSLRRPLPAPNSRAPVALDDGLD